ncbi:MAG: hypothetical protein QME40_01845 [bacterium]|nr:hypothetical protein [bacterium]
MKSIALKWNLVTMLKDNRLKYVYNEIRKSWRDTYWWNNRILGFLFKRIIGNKGTYIMNEDWGNLIILDACRYDTFKKVTGINADYRISRVHPHLSFSRRTLVDVNLIIRGGSF